MRLSFHGAAREVTGSCHLVEHAGRRILLDCGMIQGGNERHERNREPFGFDPRTLDVVILSHAHIDHSGRLPLLCGVGGYRGRILATPATVSLSAILLADTGRIQEEDARFKTKRLRKKDPEAQEIRPLYTEQDARAIRDRFVPVALDTPYDLGGGARVCFVRAGHMLGAAIVELELPGPSGARRVTFSGDLGRPHERLVGGPSMVRCPDYLLIESTYGDRLHLDEGDVSERLREAVERTLGRGGKLIIPSFAVGRAQLLLAHLNDLVESGRMPEVPVWVDSPMAVEATNVFDAHPEAYSAEAQQLSKTDRPLSFRGLRFVRSVEESKALGADPRPAVIVSASGMCTAGRIKHHLAQHISDPRSTILFVGFQAAGTLGRVIQDRMNPVRIFGESHAVRARVETIEGLSAHADRDELLAWYAGLQGVPQRTFVVHGEERTALEFAETLAQRSKGRVDAPRHGQGFDLD
jgi:metallo-beta-lactamase family protein